MMLFLNLRLFFISYLIRNEEHVVFGAQLPDFGEVSFRGDHDARLALDGLHHEGASVGVAQLGLQCGEVVVGNGDVAGERKGAI